MFTGIVQKSLAIATLDRAPGLIRLGIEFPEPMRAGLGIGASVSLDGICMTVTKIENGLVSFDAVQGTIDRTTIGDRGPSDPINVERSIKFGDEIGGHILSGHVTDTATVIGIDTASPAPYLQFTVPEEWQRYIFKRGYIAINGCSLTVAEADETLGIYRINLIPETLRVTALGRYHPGDRLNFEIDSQTQIMVDTMERCFERYGMTRLR
jgi:riboflavin synthase